MSLYDEIGGADSIKAAVAVFYQRVLDDPEIVDYFADADLGRLRAHQREFLTQALGGPHQFRGRSLAEAHAGLDITDEAFDAVIEHLAEALHDLGVADEKIAVVRETLEPMRRKVVSNHGSKRA